MNILKRIPEGYYWTGGPRAGYVLFDFKRKEICRVRSKSDARFAKRFECIKPGSLVDEVNGEELSGEI